MKRLYMMVGLLTLTLVIMAQPSWVKKTSKSVFTLKTFTADGTLLGSATGFYVDKSGGAVSCFAPFKGAQRAVVIDAAGKECPVACILGANETYDVVKFRVDTKKTQPVTLAASQPDRGATLWLLPYGQSKHTTEGILRKKETFNDTYAYYTIAMQMPENAMGAPLLNNEGEVLGLMQQSATPTDTLNYAVSALFADSLKMTGLSINDPVLRSTGIKKALPEDIGQAQLSLFIGGSSLDSLAYAQLIEDFIQQFPHHPDGYTYRAQLMAGGHRFADAEQDMMQALKVAEKPDEVHYAFSRLMMQKMVYMPDEAYEPWTLERCYDEAGEAYRINPLPTYRQQQAVVRYAQQQYDEAYTVYESLFNSTLRSPDLFYAASVCKEQLKDTTAQLALLDSCVALFSKPYVKEAAPYLMGRAQVLVGMGRYRAAVNDYNEYESLMKAQVNSNFYYLKYQAEVNGRLYQQALDDIETAITMTPQSDLYYAEKASLQVRLGLYDEAIPTATTCIQLAPEHSDGYLFLGLAQCLKGQETEGVKNLKKASELGDPQAEELIKKYSK